MKKHFLYITTFILSLISYGQIQNINELSTGIHVKSNILTDNTNNVIGYAYLFNKGLINDSKEQEYEYVILDNNLNKLTNGNYSFQYNPKISIVNYNIFFDKQKLYISSAVYNTKKGMQYGDIVTIIDLKTTTVDSQSFIVNGDYSSSYSLKELLESKKAILTDRKEFTIPLASGADIFYLNTQVNFLPSRFINQINFLNKDFNKIFNYSLTKQQNSQGRSFYINEINKNDIVIYNKTPVSSGQRKIGLDRLITFNLEKKEISSNIIYNNKSTNGDEYYTPKSEILNENLLVIGEIQSASEQNIYNIDSKPTVGIKRNIYNNKGDIILNNNVYYADIFSDLGFKNGRDSDGYKFIIRDFFNYSDYSFTVLLQKEKGDNIIIAPRTTDYILVNFDKDGKFKNYKILEKSKVKYVDTYLFSQKNKDEDEVLFFYAEQMKEESKKEWYLTINKLNKGELVQEKIPYKTESSNLRFGKAKYGYIFITEYNKDDKESSIRIEKLNL